MNRKMAGSENNMEVEVETNSIMMISNINSLQTCSKKILKHYNIGNLLSQS